MIEPADRLFAECARNSGRTAAAINLMMLFFIGYLGLKSIFKLKSRLNIFKTLLVLFAINHIIHFFFVMQNFNWHKMELSVVENFHGFITYASIIIVPLLIYKCKKLSKTLYILLLVYLFNVTYFISISFYDRYKPGIDEAYLHRLGILIMIGALFYIIYSVFAERSQPINESPTSP